MRSGEIVKEKSAFFVKKDGSFLPVSTTTTPLYTDDKISGLVTVFSDKTKQNLIDSQHHERYDGKGYSYALKANDIEPLSCIMIVADAFDAMTTDRVYKAKKNLEEALEELENLSGKQFHPEVVQCATRVLKVIN